MNVEKLKRYVGVILACLMLFAYWLDKGSNYDKPPLTFLDRTVLSAVFRELNLSSDYRLIADFYRFGVHCRHRQDPRFGYQGHRCDEPETFYPLNALDQLLLIEDSSKELQDLLSNKKLKDAFRSPEFERTFSKAAREYAKSRISAVKTIVYGVHAVWFILFLIVLKYRENVGGTILHILRTLFASASGLFRTIRRLLKELHNKV